MELLLYLESYLMPYYIFCNMYLYLLISLVYLSHLPFLTEHLFYLECLSFALSYLLNLHLFYAKFGK
jgi:hypothetical protein